MLPQQAAFKANAAQFGRQGQAALQAKRLEHAERLRKTENGEAFHAETLSRVREALTDTLQRLSTAKEPKDRELLSRAVAQLAETERKLSGRPLPGTVNRSRGEPPTPTPGLPQPR